MRWLSVAMLCAGVVHAGEGKWTPQQVQKLGSSWVKQQGFQRPLTMELLSNAVQLPGCSGSFVSKEGLLITNHHCVVGLLQEHSTPQQNLVRDGYLAAGREDEKKSASFRIQVPRSFDDVTAKVLARVPADADDRGRFHAIETAQKELVAACESSPGIKCSVTGYDGGLTFVLATFEELTDVRLVYAPPGSVGDFGGEIDNWMWPRHAGDFSLVRAYRDGKPYMPSAYFPLSTRGVKQGDAVAVLGYPGVSYRSQLADEVVEREQRWFPSLRALATEWQGIMEAESARSPQVAVATADEQRSLLNAKKNAEGQLQGLRRTRAAERRREAEVRVLAWARAHPEHAAAVQAYEALQALEREREAAWDREFLLDTIGRGSKAIGWSVLLARRSVEGERPDVEREPGYQARDLPRLREKHERDQKRYAPVVDLQLFVSWVRRVRALPAEQRLTSVDQRFKGVDDAGLVAACEALVRDSKLFDLEARKKMFEQTPAQLAALKDPMVDFGLALDVERRASRDRREAWAGRALQFRPVWRKAVLAEAGKPLAPDANSTLRITFGRVKGYSPREATQFTPFTTLAGAVAKHTGQEPFDLPARFLEKAKSPGAASTPIDFLADCDTTGGNSGSPVIDAQGRLVGVNFDRVWENVSNDFVYDPEVARNVVVDTRYLLWILQDVEGAKGLAKELIGP